MERAPTIANIAILNSLSKYTVEGTSNKCEISVLTQTFTLLQQEVLQARDPKPIPGP